MFTSTDENIYEEQNVSTFRIIVFLFTKLLNKMVYVSLKLTLYLVIISRRCQRIKITDSLSTMLQKTVRFVGS